MSRWPAIGPAAWCPVGWRYALDRIALGIRDTIRTHGADAVGILGSGALTNEKAYLLGKFARVAVGTANIDYNGRYCMSSGAAASNKAFGLDRGLPFPLEDLEGADVVLLAGSNPAETMPPFVRYLETQKARGGALIVDRSAPVGDRAAGDAAPAADAGHRHGARQRPAPRAAARRPGQPGLHRAAHRRLRQGPRRRRRLLAGARRARHRRAREEDRRGGAAPRHVRPRLRADRARPRAAVAGRRQRARLHQHRARLRLPRHRGQRLRHPHRPGQRPGRPRARPEGRPAPRLSLDQRSRRRAAPSPASGASRPTRSRDRASRPTSCSRAAAPTAASARCS